MCIFMLLLLPLLFLFLLLLLLLLFPEELNEGWNKVARRAKQYMQSGKSFAEREKFCRAGKAVPKELDLTRD